MGEEEEEEEEVEIPAAAVAGIERAGEVNLHDVVVVY